MWWQLIDAVEYMHKNNIAHRDLKLENVMLDDEKNVVLIDFGLGNFMNPGRLMKTFCGSVAYAAPEMFLSQQYNGAAVDVWSLGVMLYCMVLGYLPFEDPQRVIEADFIPLNEPIDEDDCVQPVTKEFVDLIHGIFQKNPDKRLTIEDIKKHPWTTKGLPEAPSSIISSFDDENYFARIHSYLMTFDSSDHAFPLSLSMEQCTLMPIIEPSGDSIYIEGAETISDECTSLRGRTRSFSDINRVTERLRSVSEFHHSSSDDGIYEILSKLEAYGFERRAIRRSISERSYNAITATLHLIIKRHFRERTAIQAQRRITNHH